MGVAVYVVLDREVAGFDPAALPGKAIGANYETLERLAQDSNVKSLGDFFGMSVHDAADLLGEDLPESDAVERWHEPQECIVTVIALVRALGERALGIPDPESVLADLQLLLSQLDFAKRAGARFHVTMDF
jgi:hypothetical protein